MTDEIRRYALWYFADLLDYPRGDAAEVARQCAALLAGELPRAAALVSAFQSLVASLPAGQLEEVYTGTFDLDPVCYPYVGYHVFGETYKRSVFLVALKERYRAAGYEVDGELADHVSVLLRYLAGSEDVEDTGVILREAMLPALQRMTGRAKSAGHEDETPEPPDVEAASDRRPYRDLLEALRLLLLAMADLAEDAEIELAELAHRSLAH